MGWLGAIGGALKGAAKGAAGSLGGIAGGAIKGAMSGGSEAMSKPSIVSDDPARGGIMGHMVSKSLGGSHKPRSKSFSSSRSFSGRR